MGTRKERILGKLNPVFLKMTPKLSGESGSFIDLNSEDSLEDGAIKLMTRFFKNQDLCEKNKRNPTRGDSEVIVSSVKYNEKEEICDLITERLSIPLTRNSDSDPFERPGMRLQKLKTELQEKMSAKWEEEYKKRISENESFSGKSKQNGKSQSKSGSQESCESEDEEDIDENLHKEDNLDDGEEADNESEEEENKSDNDSICDEEENFEMKEKSPEKDFEPGDSQHYDSLVPPYQPGGGLLYGGSELTQSEDGLPQHLLSPYLKLNANESPGPNTHSESLEDRVSMTPKKSEDGENALIERRKLFSQNPNNSFDLSDAFEFCSGKFPDAGEPGEGNSCGEHEEEALEDDIENKDEFTEEEEGEQEEDELQSTTENNSSKIRKNIITFEESEEEKEEEVVEKETENENLTEKKEVLKLLRDDEDEASVDESHLRKIRKNLHFSDEEDSEGGNENEGDESEKEKDEELEEEEEKEELDNRSVHYDSEENEITNAREFFEKEAELSGSEWSGDEDERGLDEFDVEEGDADVLDHNQVRSQLEKIHIRRVLDDDAREVRLIQEILFEDGDLHSDGKRRDRKFKWKNLGAFEEEGKEGESKGEGGSSSEDECAEEDERRKLRYERELFLMSNKKTEDPDLDEDLISDVRVVKISRIKACESVSKRGTNDFKMSTNFAKAPNNTLFTNLRGSFLTRNEEFLSRLAKATSAVSDNLSGPKHSRNFVFATMSPEKVAPERNTVCKRQVEDTESCGRQEKRMKVLPPQVDTGPSILDLLI